jgi:hypothetical protein
MKMKNKLNEVKRLQKLAGIKLNEGSQGEMLYKIIQFENGDYAFARTKADIGRPFKVIKTDLTLEDAEEETEKLVKDSGQKPNPFFTENNMGPINQLSDTELIKKYASQSTSDSEFYECGDELEKRGLIVNSETGKFIKPEHEKLAMKFRDEERGNKSGYYAHNSNDHYTPTEF